MIIYREFSNLYLPLHAFGASVVSRASKQASVAREIHSPCTHDDTIAGWHSPLQHSSP